MTEIEEKEAEKLRIIGKYLVEAIKKKVNEFDFNEFMDDLPSDCLQELETLDSNTQFSHDYKFDPLAVKYTGMLCIDCHKPQFITPSGDSCENGHGGAPSVPVPDGYHISPSGDLVKINTDNSHAVSAEHLAAFIYSDDE